MNASPELLRWRAAGETLSVRGQPIFYRLDGPPNAPPLVLIHGFPTASWDWHALWPALTAHYRVLAPDLLGLGFSAKPRAHDYTVAEQADLVAAIAAHVGMTDVRLVAHDYGDTVAQELLARHDAGGPLQLRCLALLNGGLFPETHHARPIQKLLLGPLGPLIARLSGRRAFGRSFAAVLGAKTQPDEAELDDFWYLIDHDGGRRVLHRLQRYMIERRARRSRWVGALQTTRVPLLLINGSADPVSGAHMVARYRELVPQQDIVELPGIGHYPQVEAPQAVLAALTPFLVRRDEACRAESGRTTAVRCAEVRSLDGIRDALRPAVRVSSRRALAGAPRCSCHPPPPAAPSLLRCAEHPARALMRGGEASDASGRVVMRMLLRALGGWSGRFGTGQEVAACAGPRTSQGNRWAELCDGQT